MIYSIIILSLLLVALILYFVLSRKIKTPTVVTELLTKKYNDRLSKLYVFLKKNGINFVAAEYECKLEDSLLSWQAVEENIKAIENIKENVKLIGEIYKATKKQQVEELLKNLHAPCKIRQFMGELEQEKQGAQIFEVLGFNKTKLDFEQQRYFGSQQFFKIGDMFFFFGKQKVLTVDINNIFKCAIEDYFVEVNFIEDEGDGKIFEAQINIGEKSFVQKVLAEDKQTIKFLQEYNKKPKQTTKSTQKSNKTQKTKQKPKKEK